ncbi:hypothetical protein AN639_10135 [Candidatus Epulonipiscium fishelsonii]|uniref:Uncharacterized protein n=1 Tax=Candidatus Epulonipiscium fishelsonii TaxID=77094 RepID=A0ACC8X876_9FIRM|nr:hypothetical protein AN396_11205 [Epulopiscium sp. SCG-B11WGA-EpuloA1]ONI43680.1 hypothetical protein AN639_10135 [Epulopiscium sp. SCG-B05WGA-EpuloA1]
MLSYLFRILSNNSKNTHDSIGGDITINIALKLRKKIPSILDVNRSSRDMIRNVLYRQFLTQMKLEDIKEMI